MRRETYPKFEQERWIVGADALGGGALFHAPRDAKARREREKATRIGEVV